MGFANYFNNQTEKMQKINKIIIIKKINTKPIKLLFKQNVVFFSFFSLLLFFFNYSYLLLQKHYVTI